MGLRRHSSSPRPLLPNCDNALPGQLRPGSYRVFTPDSLFDIVSRHRLHYDHTSQTGIVLHMLCDVGGSGQFGVTAIADSHAEADALYERFLAVIEQEAQARRQAWGAM